ncbi:hypothetical protein ACWC4D_34195 [Streptomyces sp. NPDC001288]|uniref:hypothetical protein n=1 Tax=Streptomyces sp. NPDC001297 TaxID=3364559 RepID=UPI00367D7E93
MRNRIKRYVFRFVCLMDTCGLALADGRRGRTGTDSGHADGDAGRRPDPPARHTRCVGDPSAQVR